jgi:peroxiredoxin
LGFRQVFAQNLGVGTQVAQGGSQVMRDGAGELCAIRDQYVDFVNDDTVVLSVSCDSPYTLKVFAEQESLTHALLSDFWPHGEASKAYGVFLDDKGFSTRGTFIIDKEGVVRWSVVNGPGEARESADYKAALAAL